MKIGDSVETARSFSTHDVAAHVALGGGAPAAHAVPEPLIGALFSYLLGTKLPGPGTKYLKQNLEFLAPGPLDTPLSATVTVTRIRPEKNLVDLETTCRTADGTLICRGRALVMVDDALKARNAELPAS